MSNISTNSHPPRGEQVNSRFNTLTKSSLVCLLLCAVAGMASCNGTSQIPNLTKSAVALPSNVSYAGPRMNVPRYSHTVTPLADGSVLVVGGTDELHLTAIDTVELFDQSLFVGLSQPTPESISGDFIDQDIDGNLIALVNGGRFFHTSNAIEDENVIVIGGTNNIRLGIANATSEVYDPQTRAFSLQIAPADDIEVPRVRHTTHRLSNGKLLIAGGQEYDNIFIPGGGPFGQTTTQDAYATTEKIEIFDPSNRSFSTAVDSIGFETELTTSRGRAGHASVTFAGFDEQMNTTDDLVGFLGGMMTLSALSLNAPDDLFPWNPLQTKLTSLDFYHPPTGTVNLAQGLALTERMNDPIAINLGEDRVNTPFGDIGMGNVVLIFGGDNDNAGCPEGAAATGGNSTDASELLVATYTGFGPANGARFFRQTGGDSFTHGSEVKTAGLPNCPESYNRSKTAGVLLDMIRTYDGQNFITSAVVCVGGHDATLEITGECTTTTTSLAFLNSPPCVANQVWGYHFFDPFFNVESENEPWNWRGNETTQNPLGIRGTWLGFDSVVPSETVDGFGGPLPEDTVLLPRLKAGRLMHTLSRIPGEDGLIGTLDDRVVAIGGTGSYIPTFGDDALSTSCEIYLPPDAGIPVAP